MSPLPTTTSVPTTKQTMASNIWPACDTATHRLSKPRTNTSSSNLLNLASQQNQPSSPLTPSEHSLSSDNVTIKASRSVDRRSRRKSRTRLREFLHGYSSEEEDSQKQKGTKRGVRDRLSRSGSSFSRVASANSSAIHLSSSSNRELDNEKSELVRKEIREKAYTDSVAAQNHVPEPIDDDDMHPDEMKSPIRRRSLYTPGLATRSPDDLLRKPPQPGQQNVQAARTQCDMAALFSLPAHDLATATFSLGSALATTPDGRSTPVHFSQLGGLGLGTLMITNDVRVPSPEPNSEIHRQMSSSIPGRMSQEDNEYFTASEGDKSEDDALSMVAVAATDTPKAIPRSGSPLKYESGWGNVSSQRQPALSPSETSSPIQDDRQITTAAHESCAARSTDYFSQSSAYSESPDRASEFAQNYMAELPPSPYRDIPPVADFPRHSVDKNYTGNWVPKASHCSGMSTQDEALQAGKTGRPLTDAWRRLFNEEAEARHAYSVTKEDAYRILNGEFPSRVSNLASNQPLNLSSGDRERDDRPKSSSARTSNALSRSDAGHDDSGYMSRNVSAQSLHGDSKSDPAISNERWPGNQCAISGPRNMPQQSLRGTEACPDPPEQCDTSAHIPPTLEVVPRPPTSITTTFETSVARSQSQPVVPTIDASPSDFQQHTTGPSEDASASDLTHRSPHSSSYQQSVPFSTGSPLKARKLQKPRRLSKGPKRPKKIDMTAVQAISEMTLMNVPTVSQDLAMKHAARTSVHPVQNYTYHDLQDEQSEGRRCSLSETSLVSIRFPSPTNSIEERSDSIMRADIDWPTRPKKKEKKKAKELKAEQAGERKIRGRHMSQGEALAEIADSGTVTNSIGRSPHDAAMPEGSSKPRAASNISPCPHQISTDSARPKSVAFLDDTAAVEASRYHTQVNGRDETFRRQTASRTILDNRQGLPGHESRPRSMFAQSSHSMAIEGFRSGKSFHSHSQQSLENVRPRSMYVDVPPVPTLPSANEAQHLEAMARRGRQPDAPIVQAATSNRRPAKLVRPKSMYDSTPSYHLPSASYQTLSEQRLPEVGIPQSSTPQSGLQEVSSFSSRSAMPEVERSKTAIYLGSPASHMRHSTYGIIERRDSPQEELAKYKSSQSAQPDLRTYDAILPDPYSDLAPTKLKKRRPLSVGPDVWKSESLRDKVKQVGLAKGENSSIHLRESYAPSESEDSLEWIAPESSAREAANGNHSKRPQSVGEALLANSNYGKPSASQSCRPVAAPSLHDALRAHGFNTPNSTVVTPLPSTLGTTQEVSASPASPLSTTNGTSNVSGEHRSYFPSTPTRRAAPYSTDGTKRTSVLTIQSTRPPPPTILNGLPVGDMPVFPERRDPALDGFVYNKKKKRYEQHDITPPRTPGRRINLNPPSCENTPPTTKTPTAVSSTTSETNTSTSPTKATSPSRKPGRIINFNAQSCENIPPTTTTPTAAPPTTLGTSPGTSPTKNTSPPRTSRRRINLNVPSCETTPVSTRAPTAASPTISRTRPSTSPTKNTSPPRTPGKRISLNCSPSRNSFPKISIPTADVADSYTSHAGPAPAPPPFSIPRKRLSGLNCFNTTPSARSLKQLSVSPEPDSPAGRIPTAPPSASRAPSGPTTPQRPDANLLKHANGLKSHPVTPAMPEEEPTTLPTHEPIVLNPPTRMENLSGRGGGGLGFGYEPGVGLGGSAGTRVPGTEAARQSVIMSKQTGVDLSDVPIPRFAPEPARLDTAARSGDLAGRGGGGGLQNGFEPGVGLGDSAGMRVPESGPSRQSVNMASQFGLDIIDLPVLVQHTGPEA